MKIYVGGSLRDVTVDEDLCKQFIEKHPVKGAQFLTQSLRFGEGAAGGSAAQHRRLRPPGRGGRLG